MKIIISVLNAINMYLKPKITIRVKIRTKTIHKTKTKAKTKIHTNQRNKIKLIGLFQKSCFRRNQKL